MHTSSVERLSDLVAKSSITMETTYTGNGIDNGGWDRYDWNITLINGRQTMVVPFYRGNEEEPTVSEVLACLVSDAQAYRDTRDVHAFYEEFGYTDTRTAWEVYDQIKKQTEELRTFLGNDYDRFMNAEGDI